MVSSAVDICNLSCDLLQVDPITNIDTPSTNVEEVFSRWYNHTRKAILRRHAWNFATDRAQLAASSETPPFGWSAKFKLPSDYIRLLYASESNINYDSPIPSKSYTVEGDYIFTGNLTSSLPTALNLVYIKDVTDVTKMDSLFIHYVAVNLALNTSYILTQSNTNVDKLNTLARDIELKAKAMDGQENPPKRVERSKHLAARRRTSSPRNYDGLIIFD